MESPLNKHPEPEADARASLKSIHDMMYFQCVWEFYSFPDHESVWDDILASSEEDGLKRLGEQVELGTSLPDSQVFEFLRNSMFDEVAEVRDWLARLRHLVNSRLEAIAELRSALIAQGIAAAYPARLTQVCRGHRGMEVVVAVSTRLRQAEIRTAKRLYVGLLCACRVPFKVPEAFPLFEEYEGYQPRCELAIDLINSHAQGVGEWVLGLLRSPVRYEKPREDFSDRWRMGNKLLAAAHRMKYAQGKLLLEAVSTDFAEYWVDAVDFFGRFGGERELALLTANRQGLLDSGADAKKLDKAIHLLESRLGGTGTPQ